MSEWLREEFVTEVQKCTAARENSEKGGLRKQAVDQIQEIDLHSIIHEKQEGTRTSPVLAVVSITSLEHAISIIDSLRAPDVEPEREQGAEYTSQPQPPPLVAAYYFGTPDVGRYLSTSITASVSFVNHIPPPLLLGPLAPVGKVVDVQMRYTTTHLSTPAPVFINPGPSSSTLLQVSGAEADALLADAERELREEKRPEGIGRGFFEQGIVIGLGVYGVPLLAVVGGAVVWGVRSGWRRWGAMGI